MRREKLLKKIALDRLLDLKVDFAFKQLFGSEKNKSITIVFLNAILQRTNRGIIKNIEFKNIELIPEYQEDKESRLDILAETDTGEYINIEIQFTNQYDMVKRSIYYWAQLYAAPLGKGEFYKTLQPVIAINIMNFNLFKDTNQFHTSYHLFEDEEKFKLTDAMEFHFVEMPKLLGDWQAGKLAPWDDVLARWLLLLGMVDHRKVKVYEDIYKELEAIAMEDKNLQKAFESWEVLSGTKEEVAAYQARVKKIYDEQSMIGEARMRGREEGLEEGMEKGLEKGLEEGIEKGVTLEKQSVAQKLIDEKMPLESIVKITELSLEEVQSIQKGMQ